MEIDTGASVSVVSESFYKQYLAHMQLNPTAKKMRSYSGDTLQVLSELDVNTTYKKQQARFPLVVIAGNHPALLGRNWLRKLKLDWSAIFSIQVTTDSDLDKILEQHTQLLDGEPGCIEGYEAELRLKDGAKPVFVKARPVPYAVKPMVDQELDRQVHAGILKKVPYSEWSSPVVVVPKADRTVRLCGDYKVSLNPALEVDKYPLPNLEDMLASLADGSVFSKLDFSTAYLQLEVSPESKPLLTINTHRGLYQYQRLNYGVASAPAIFQETMDKILHGLEKVCYFIDDILISSSSKEEHLILLNEVLRRLEVHGIKIKRRKCKFLKPSITYLGYCIDKDGIHPTGDKVKAINGARRPQDATELRAWLGLLKYYGRFIRDLSSIFHPLNNLLQKDVPFQWTQECDIAFNECKLAISGDQVLVHYDVRSPYN